MSKEKGVTQEAAITGDARKKTTFLQAYRLRAEGDDIVFDRRRPAEQLADDRKPVAVRSAKARVSCFHLADLFPAGEDKLGDWEISVTFTPHKDPL